MDKIPRMIMDSSWAKLITTVGFPGALLCYLIYNLTTGMGSDYKTMKDDLKEIRTEFRMHMEDIRALRAEGTYQTKIFQRICVNTAKNSQDRNGCF